MDLQELHNHLDFLLRKRQAGYLSPEEKDRVINRAQVTLFDELKGAYSVNQQVQDALLPFKKEQAFTNGTSAAGLITLNTDYVHLLAIETVVSDADGTHYVPVEIVHEDQLSERKNSQLIPVTVNNPIGTLKAPATVNAAYRFQLLPAQASAGTIHYLRKPQDVQFVYTLVGRTITYNSSTSKQLEWNEPMVERLISHCLIILGLPLQDQLAMQIGAQKLGGTSGN